MRAHRLYGPGPSEPEPFEAVPDLAGIPVDDANGRYAGVLRGSLAEVESGMIRYLDVAMDDGGRHVLVPLGHARLERDRTGHDRMHLLAASRDDLGKIPSYEPGKHVDEELGKALAREHGRLFHGERYYAHPAFDHSGMYAGEHPIIRGPIPRPGAGPLYRLSELPEHRVAEGEPDVRGWPVVLGGRRVAIIDDLVVDPDQGKARYLVLMLSVDERRVLVPIGYLRIHRDSATVNAPALTADDLNALPRYGGGPITRGMEKNVRGVLADRLDGDGRHFRRPDYEPAGRGARAAGLAP